MERKNEQLVLSIVQKSGKTGIEGVWRNFGRATSFMVVFNQLEDLVRQGKITREKKGKNVLKWIWKAKGGSYGR